MAAWRMGSGAVRLVARPKHQVAMLGRLFTPTRAAGHSASSASRPSTPTLSSSSCPAPTTPCTTCGAAHACQRSSAAGDQAEAPSGHAGQALHAHQGPLPAQPAGPARPRSPPRPALRRPRPARPVGQRTHVSRVAQLVARPKHQVAMPGKLFTTRAAGHSASLVSRPSVRMLSPWSCPALITLCTTCWAVRKNQRSESVPGMHMCQAVQPGQQAQHAHGPPCTQHACATCQQTHTRHLSEMVPNRLSVPALCSA